MKFNLSHFRKLHSDKKSTTLKHPDGHEITVAHEHLTPKVRGQLESMPIVQNMADGDLVQSQEQLMTPMNSPIPPNQSLPEDFMNQVEAEKRRLAVNSGAPIPMQGGSVDPSLLNSFKDQAETNVAAMSLRDKDKVDMAAADNYKNQLAKVDEDNIVRQKVGLPPLPKPTPPEVLVQMTNTQMPQASMGQPQAAPQEQGPNDPYGTEAYYNNLNKGIREQKAGLQKQYQAESALGQDQAQHLEKNIDATQKLMDMHQQNVNSLNQERQSLMQDAMNGHIDPARYWNNQSTFGKVKTAISLIGAGFGAGMLHQENPAMKFLNDQIDRDINSQKANLEQKNNLLSANRTSFQNERDATDMTRVMLADQMSSQLKLAASKQADPMAKARLLQAAGDLDTKYAPVFSQMAMRRTILGGTKQGVIDPSMSIRAIVPEHQQPAAYKELSEAQQMNRAKDNILGSFDKLTHLNTIGNAISSPLQTSKQVSAIRDPLVASLSKETAGRFTEQDSKMLSVLFPAKGDSPQTIQLKRNQINKLISEKMNFPLLNSYGIQPASLGRFNNSGQSKIQMAPPIIK